MVGDRIVKEIPSQKAVASGVLRKAAWCGLIWGGTPQVEDAANAET